MHKIRDWSLFLRDMLQLTGKMMALAWHTLPFCCFLVLVKESTEVFRFEKLRKGLFSLCSNSLVCCLDAWSHGGHNKAFILNKEYYDLPILGSKSVFL